MTVTHPEEESMLRGIMSRILISTFLMLFPIAAQAQPETPIPRVYKVGGDVKAPQVITKVQPDYTDEARDAALEGTVVLGIVVDEKGEARDIRVIRVLGLGLDKKAVDAVKKWKFKPGTKDGNDVAVQATIEMVFRLK